MVTCSFVAHPTVDAECVTPVGFSTARPISKSARRRWRDRIVTAAKLATEKCLPSYLPSVVSPVFHRTEYIVVEVPAEKCAPPKADNIDRLDSRVQNAILSLSPLLGLSEQSSCATRSDDAFLSRSVECQTDLDARCCETGFISLSALEAILEENTDRITEAAQRMFERRFQEYESVLEQKFDEKLAASLNCLSFQTDQTNHLIGDMDSATFWSSMESHAVEVCPREWSTFEGARSRNAEIPPRITPRFEGAMGDIVRVVKSPHNAALLGKQCFLISFVSAEHCWLAEVDEMEDDMLLRDCELELVMSAADV